MTEKSRTIEQILSDSRPHPIDSMVEDVEGESIALRVEGCKARMEIDIHSLGQVFGRIATQNGQEMRVLLDNRNGTSTITDIDTRVSPNTKNEQSSPRDHLRIIK